jgi:hypothetical protein
LLIFFVLKKRQTRQQGAEIWLGSATYISSSFGQTGTATSSPVNSNIVPVSLGFREGKMK